VTLKSVSHVGSIAMAWDYGSSVMVTALHIAVYVQGAIVAFQDGDRVIFGFVSFSHEYLAIPSWLFVSPWCVELWFSEGCIRYSNNSGEDQKAGDTKLNRLSNVISSE